MFVAHVAKTLLFACIEIIRNELNVVRFKLSGSKKQRRVTSIINVRKESHANGFWNGFPVTESGKNPR